MKKIGALEAGGTKMVLAVYTQDGSELERLTLPTETPEKTMPSMIAFFRDHAVDALGVGSFGPLDLNPASPTYGCITSTPKLAWRDYPLLSALLDGRDIPAGIDTDVNAAVMAECELGAARGCQSAVYITVGTGIGGGVYVNGQTVHGLLHPEVGHMLLRPHPDDPNPHGVCPYHDGCLEGLAAGPAIGARIGGDARTLADGHPTFALEAYYLAQMCVNLIVTVSPERILLGGGVMQRECLLPMVRQNTLELLNGYVQSPMITKRMEEYIVAPALYPVSGLVGSYLIGKRAAGM
ncbi:MAG: ROK family protein [Clostridiales bacterium]|nr:ROK family protein [Clostridiales bacterium]MDO4351024.1 ROK family protein [Eubacteriales bacterium]MDY4008294.1 ROK family protein [Candidatus Limiplasma sp.]